MERSCGNELWKGAVKRSCGTGCGTYESEAVRTREGESCGNELWNVRERGGEGEDREEEGVRPRREPTLDQEERMRGLIRGLQMGH